jgi:hypothetical protein
MVEDMTIDCESERSNDNPLPFYAGPSGPVCCYCGRLMMAQDTVTKGRFPTGHHALVDHGDIPEHLLELDFVIYVCPNNGKQWIIDTTHIQPRIYPVDPATGEIDEMGGRL